MNRNMCLTCRHFKEFKDRSIRGICVEVSRFLGTTNSSKIENEIVVDGIFGCVLHETQHDHEIKLIKDKQYE